MIFKEFLQLKIWKCGINLYSHPISLILLNIIQHNRLPSDIKWLVELNGSVVFNLISVRIQLYPEKTLRVC